MKIMSIGRLSTRSLCSLRFLKDPTSNKEQALLKLDLDPNPAMYPRRVIRHMDKLLCWKGQSSAQIR
ncbi:hypothetical protein AMECASPLE_028881 [Ameca splendens]|uniref:Uncharacterized protein n=1 Tax=Ameca splendens TaxID=208324 RepID=A0ABV0Y5P0_9TELE